MAGETVLAEVIEKAGYNRDDLKYIISTGYGRRAGSYAHKSLTEIICHGAGVSSVRENARTIINIRGQDS